MIDPWDFTLYDDNDTVSVDGNGTSDDHKTLLSCKKFFGAIFRIYTVKGMKQHLSMSWPLFLTFCRDFKLLSSNCGGTSFNPMTVNDILWSYMYGVKVDVSQCSAEFCLSVRWSKQPGTGRWS